MLPFDGLGRDGRIVATGERMVYVFQDEHDRFKVGFTATGDPWSRGRSFQTGNGDRIKYFGAFVVGPDETDANYHRQLAMYWLHHEWFRKTPESTRLIKGWIERRRDLSRDEPIDILISRKHFGSRVLAPWDCRQCKAGMFCCVTDAESLIGQTFTASCWRCQTRMPIRFLAALPWVE